MEAWLNQKTVWAVQMKNQWTVILFVAPGTTGKKNNVDIFHAFLCCERRILYILQ